MAYYPLTLTDLEYSDYENFICPYDYDCKDCEYDCEMEDDDE